MSIKKNLIYNIMYQMLILVIPLITIPYVARVIGPEGIGIQSYTFSVASYFVLFAMLGINNHGNRSIAMVRDDKEKLSKTFLGLYLLQLIIAVSILIIYLLYVLLIVKRYKIFFLIQSFYIVSAIFDINWFFFGLEQFKITVIRNVIIKILSVISIFIFVKNEKDIYIYSFILAITMLISQIVLWKFLRNYIIKVDIEIKDIIDNIKPTLILFIPLVAVSIYKIMDKIMLGAMSSIQQVGFYENSEKIVSIPMAIIVALGTVMLPRMSNLYAQKNHEKSNRYISISIELVMFLALGAMFGIIAISPVMIPIFLGNDFIECINIVKILSITIPFLAWANVIRTQFLIPNKKDGIFIKSTIIGAIVNVLINFMLIPKLGAIGAAIGTIFAEISVAIYQTIKVKKDLEIKKYFKNSIFYVISSLIMYFVLRSCGNILNNDIYAIIIQLIVGIFVYSAISMLYIVCMKKDRINKIINSFKKNKFNYK